MGLPLPKELLDLAGATATATQGVAPTASESWDSDGVSAPAYDGRKHLWLYKAPNGKDDPCYWEKIPQEWKDEAALIKEITPDMWKPPGAPEKLPADFIKWCLSINPRFDEMIPYKPFYLFCEAARRWNSEDGGIEQFPEGSQEWIDYGLREMRRCSTNRLYGLDRYITITEDNKGGRRKYSASTPQAMIAYMESILVSTVIKKGRHAAITSTFNACDVFDIMLTPSFKGALITDDVGTTAKNIFLDKFVPTLKNMPKWFRPSDEFGHYAHEKDEKIILQFGKKRGSKADKKMKVSSYSLVSGKDTQAVNGLTLTKLRIDEAQNVANVKKIIEERRPQMWAEVDGMQRLVRMNAIWGCVCAGTKVWTNDGALVNIEDLDPKKGIIGYDGNGASREPILYWQPPAEKPCYRITTITGRYLECSEDHPILWGRKGLSRWSQRTGKRKPNVFKEAKDIAVGDQVAVIDSVPFHGEKKMWEPRLVGWLIGDGYYGKFGARLSTADKEIQDYVFSNLKCVREKGHTTKDGREYMEIRINGIQENLRQIGIFGQSKNAKRLPLNIHSYCKESAASLLGGLFDADGCVIVPSKGALHPPSLNLTSSCYELIDETRFLLQKFGVHCTIHRVKCNPLTNPRDKNDWYVLNISKEDSMRAFREHIGFFLPRKKEKLDRAIEWKVAQRAKSKYKPKFKTPGISFERVKKVEFIGLRPIYNLTAGNSNTYVANGIVTHNTGNANGKNSAEFDDLYQQIKQQMIEGVNTGGMVALFFDGFCRPGVDKEHYYTEWQRVASGSDSSSKDRSAQDQKLIFASRFPLTDDDATAQNSDSVLPMHVIKSHKDRIVTRLRGRIRRGRFVEIFDMEKPMPPGSDYPFYVIGARFEEGGPDNEILPVTMLFDKEEGCYANYFQGTDPIQSFTGRSKMASNIMAASAMHYIDDNKRQMHVPASVCWVNMRHPNPVMNYKQCKLMGMYYANEGERACRELVEFNQGHDYVRFCESPPMLCGDSLIHNYELPSIYQDSGNHPGIVKNSINTGHIHADIIRFNDECGHNEYSIEYYHQLSHMVQGETKNNRITFGTIDVEKFNDDLVDAKTYSYIAMKMSYEVPRRKGKDIGAVDTKMVLRRDPRTGSSMYVQERSFMGETNFAFIK